MRESVDFGMFLRHCATNQFCLQLLFKILLVMDYVFSGCVHDKHFQCICIGTTVSVCREHAPYFSKVQYWQISTVESAGGSLANNHVQPKTVHDCTVFGQHSYVEGSWLHLYTSYGFPIF